MKERLFTKDYLAINLANSLLYFAFWFLMPVLPFYLSDVFDANKATIGAVLSSYTIAGLCIRPFSGYLLDSFSRKPLYLLAYFIFTAIFGGYILAFTLTLFILFRVVHGLAFGMVTVSSNTIVIDIMPSSRRGEGLGYYGLSNNIAMSIGPMTGLFLHDSGMDYPYIFCIATAVCLCGFLSASTVKTPYKPCIKRSALSLDRFILLKGLPAGFCLLLLSVPYGMTTNYVAMYAKQIGISHSTGFFFSLMAIGMATSRLFAGRLVDKGKMLTVIQWGLYLVCFCFFSISACGWLIHYSPQFTENYFFAIALGLGVGFGSIFPAYNTLFVNLAPNSQRGTATSTYLTSWDVGLGIGMVAGGYIAEVSTFKMAYLCGAILTVFSVFYFKHTVAPHFTKNKLR